jgi:hypothetical protein
MKFADGGKRRVRTSERPCPCLWRGQGTLNTSSRLKVWPPDTIELIVLNGLEVARRATDQVGECAPTLFVVRGDTPDWAHPVPIAHPREYLAGRAAAKSGVRLSLVVAFVH